MAKLSTSRKRGAPTSSRASRRKVHRPAAVLPFTLAQSSPHALRRTARPRRVSSRNAAGLRLVASRPAPVRQTSAPVAEPILTAMAAMVSELRSMPATPEAFVAVLFRGVTALGRYRLPAAGGRS